MNDLWRSLKMFLWLSLMTGILYPLLITGIAQLTMKHKADGSFLEYQGKKIGSSLIAQKFEGAKYFWPRPSFVDYDPLPSGGSNLGPTSAALRKMVNERRAILRRAQGNDNTPIPSEFLYASGSGLDPHISPSGARFQAARIVKARGWDQQRGMEEIMKLINQSIERRPFGFLGKTRVNVLQINIALDELESQFKKQPQNLLRK